jgi:glycosyltransferase involved in cell wall biosynthesis
VRIKADAAHELGTAQKVRVLLVSHTCMSRTAGQPKLHCLAAHEDIDLVALVPDRMCTYDEWHDAEPAENARFRFVVGHTRWQYIRRQWYLLHYRDTVGRLIRDFQPDVIDIWEEPWSLVSAQCVFLVKRLAPRAKVIVETEQNIYKDLPPPFRAFQSYSIRNADFMVARNSEAIDVLRRKGYDGPARVVPNAVECRLFRPLPKTERAAVRASLGVDETSFVAGYVGRLVGDKGLADAVEAIAALPEDVRLIFVGTGPMQEELGSLVERHGVRHRVTFAGGRPLTELPGIMNALDVLILPSHTTASWKEQFGRVLIEAGACGVAVAGSSSGAIPEVIGDAGLVFPEKDPQALAASLRRLRDDPELLRRCGEIGYERATTRFSWECVAAQMRDIYRESLGRRSSGTENASLATGDAGAMGQEHANAWGK